MFQTEFHSSSSGDALQSIRSSCDRCRLQKLKCTIQVVEADGRSLCERCVRAKAPCVFGRRRRASRPSDKKKQRTAETLSRTNSYQDTTTAVTRRLPTPTSSTGDAPMGSITPPPPHAPPALSSSSSLETPPETMMEIEAEQQPQPQHEAPSHHHQQQQQHHDHQTWESFTHALNHSTNGIDAHQSGTMFGWHWLDQDFNSDDMYRLDLDLLDTTPPSASAYSDSPTPSHGHYHQPTDQHTAATVNPANTTHNPATMELSNSENNNNNHNSGTITPPSLAWRRLPALIAEMQQRLETLESGSWLHDNDARSFDRYPIGTVLRLSQEFGGLAGQVLGLAASYGSDSLSMSSSSSSSMTFSGMAHLQQQQDGNGAATNNNTATVLLVLGGYLSLVRLYGLVLGHFHERLVRIPCGGLSNLNINMNMGMHGLATPGTLSPSHSMVNLNTNATLQLGELPRHGTMPDVNRIHAALGMLLTALHHVEEQVGKGGEVARDMAVALLTDGTGTGVETLKLGTDLGDLGEKVRSVKDLLREKMGL